MSVDLAVNNLTWDLSIQNGQLVLVSKAAQVAQAIGIRLQRLLGEWFLNTGVGIPWYGANGILGSKDQNNAELLIRQEILNTPQVQQLVSLTPVWDATSRTLSIAAQVLTSYGQVVSTQVTVGG
jgi:hypothetical protein